MTISAVERGQHWMWVARVLERRELRWRIRRREARLGEQNETVRPIGCWLPRVPSNDKTERRGRPSASALATDVARPRSLQW